MERAGQGRAAMEETVIAIPPLAQFLSTLIDRDAHTPMTRKTPYTTAGLYALYTRFHARMKAGPPLGREEFERELLEYQGEARAEPPAGA